MRAVISAVDAGARSLAYFLGAVVLALAVGKAATSLDTAAIAAWTWHVYGATFLTLFAALVIATLFSWNQMRHGAEPRLWFEVGMHTAGGIATLALTFTLLGICMGIASLTVQELTPDTLHDVMARLTASFSMAFLADVVGLPTATALRALISITAVARGIVEPTRDAAVASADITLDEENARDAGGAEPTDDPYSATPQAVAG